MSAPLKPEESAFKMVHSHAGKLLLSRGQDQEPLTAHPVSVSIWPGLPCNSLAEFQDQVFPDRARWKLLQLALKAYGSYFPPVLLAEAILKACSSTRGECIVKKYRLIDSNL